MKVILLKDCEGLGLKSDLVDVKDGHARNFLIPQGIASQVTAGVLKELEFKSAAEGKKKSREVKRFKELKDRLSDLSLTIGVKAGEEEKMYGAVTNIDIAKALKNEGFDIVSGWKKKRYDPLSKRIPSKFFNLITRKISGIKLHDFNCGLKAYKSDVIKSIEVYGEMHRYIPVIAKWAGFNKIGELIVHHQERKYGTSKFGSGRLIKGFLDLLSISFVSKFGRKPMHLFGTLGVFLFIIGFGIAGYLAYSKIFLATYKMTERPLFYLGLLSMILGTQVFMTGFIAELISRNSSERNKYIIEQKIL